jgi:hypothetical protein
MFYVFVGLLAVNLALSIWVAYSFSNNRFEYVWPIQFLRWFGLIFYQVRGRGSRACACLIGTAVALHIEKQVLSGRARTHRAQSCAHESPVCFFPLRW